MAFIECRGRIIAGTEAGPIVSLQGEDQLKDKGKFVLVYGEYRTGGTFFFHDLFPAGLLFVRERRDDEAPVHLPAALLLIIGRAGGFPVLPALDKTLRILLPAHVTHSRKSPMQRERGITPSPSC